MGKYYTDEKNALIVIALLKAHGIRKVVASPGTTNVALVGSVQHDPYFQVFSSVDERSAAYMACGLAYELGEPVVISCTGATASRNYLPGLTEAFYRKLPVLAITSAQNFAKVGHHVAQVIDRSTKPNDAVRFSVQLPIVKDSDDFWECEVKVNQAILELKRHGGGPVHIDLPTVYCREYQTKELPKCRVINRWTTKDALPELSGRVAIFIGAHKPFTENETKALDDFCAAHDAVVFCDHTSTYKGKYRVLYSLVASQDMLDLAVDRPDALIHIGEISGDYASLTMAGKEVWRVSEDGELRDTFRKLRHVFEMDEEYFFNTYAKNSNQTSDRYLQQCHGRLEDIRKNMPDLPFSNIWLASKIAHLIPDGSVVHFGILNSLRTWNFFELPKTVTSMSNVGGFGIDGGLSTLFGASLANPEKLYFGVIGDLAFFYDMNALGNRHVGKNLRLLLVNNGKGTEFRQYNHHAALFGEDAEEFIAAAGHFGNKSPELVKNYTQALGFEYLRASNKEEFASVMKRFLTPELTDKPMFLEVFTDSKDESDALKMLRNLEVSTEAQVKQIAKNILGNTGTKFVKKFIGR